MNTKTQYRWGSRWIGALFVALSAGACSSGEPGAKAAASSARSIESPGTKPAADAPMVEVPGAAPAASDSPPQEPGVSQPDQELFEKEQRAKADSQRRVRAKQLFGELIEPLTETAEAYSVHESLEEDTWLGKDQVDNQKHIDELLDDAIGALGISEIAGTRKHLRLLQQEVRDLKAKLVSYREQRILAPTEEELNKLQKTYTESREDLDQMLVDAEGEIVDRERQIGDLERDFVIQMRAIGVDLNLDSARSLLSTVSGDDFIEMCIVFDNVRGLTLQLQELTEESGESLEAAKRYYGSYVVLIHIMDRVQLDLMRRIKDEMLPRLAQFSKDATQLIQNAKDNMAQGGNQKIGEQNIASNELTMRATEFYGEYLNQQSSEIAARNKQLRVSLRDAQNTLDTVSLSSEMADLMKEGSRNFGALLKLELPDLRGFENEELRAEFERLTGLMTDFN
jgi:hypothetical protein